MRFRRTFLASLAPLIGFSALMAAMCVEPGVTRGARPLIRLFQSVVQLAAPACDYTTAGPSHERPPARALLAFAALAVTPFGHSLWMVARRPSIQLSFRRHLQAPLRC